MERQGECFVSGPLATILRVTRCAGMAPLRFQKQGNGWRVSLSRGYLKLGYFIITVINILFLGVLFMISKDQPRTNRYISIFDVCLTTGLVGTLIYGGPKHMRCLIRSLNQVYKINSDLNVHHWSTPWTRNQIVLSIIWGAFSVAVNLSGFVFLTYLNLSIQPFQYIRLVVNLFSLLRFCFTALIELGVVQFSQLVLHVRSSFTVVNDCLRNLLQDNSTIPSAHKMVHRISSSYSAACAVVRDVNRSFGLMMILMISDIFLQLIITSYHLTFSLFLKEEPVTVMESLTLIGFVLGYFVYNLVCLMMLMEPCYWTNVEMENTKKLVARLILYPCSAYDPLAVELEQFWAQLELNNVSFTPMYLTTITRSSLLTILSSLTTYLVILIETRR